MTIGESWSGGGFAASMRSGSVNGLTIREITHTGVQCQTENQNLTITDFLWENQRAIHGNGVSNYFGSRDNTIQNSASIDATRFITTQTTGVSITYPRNLAYRDLFMLGIRTISPDPVASVELDYTFRIDAGLGGSVIDRVLMGDGEFEWLRPGADSPNDNAVISRSHIQNHQSYTDSFAATAGGDPVLFKHVNIAAGRTDPITGGGIVIDPSAENPGGWTGAPSEVQWRRLTINSTSDGYEQVQVGAARWNWSIPAYDPADPQPGIPLDLQLSRTDYYVKCQPGRTIAAIVGARPMSAISLPAGVADNDLFLLDHGRLVAKVRLPEGPLTVAVDETPAAKLGGVWTPQPLDARRTVLSLTGRR